MNIFDAINKIAKGGLTIFILYLMGVVCVSGATCGNLFVALVFIAIALIGGFWIIGLIWGWNKDNTSNEPFNGDDALGCISGQVIADEVTRGIQK